MLLSQHDIQSAELSFDPPMTKRAKTRKVYLSTHTGVLLAGIKCSQKSGVNVPAVLKVTNRPEYGEGSQALEQPVSELTREVLAGRIREKLAEGVPLWPSQDRRRIE